MPEQHPPDPGDEQAGDDEALDRRRMIRLGGLIAATTAGAAVASVADAAVAGASDLEDGDKGDVTVTGNGTIWTVDADSPAVAGKVSKAGDVMTGPLEVPPDPYSASGWSASNEVPTKDAVRDRIEGLPLPVAGAHITITSAAGLTTIAAEATFAERALPLVVRADDDEVLTSSAAVHDDAELFVAVAADATYEVASHIIYDGPGIGADGADFRIGWSCPGATFHWTPSGLISNAGGSTAAFHHGAATLGSTAIVGATNIGTALVATPSGILATTSAATFRFRWAQGIATASSTTRRAGSTLILRRIA
jgi:hypothetical protein